MVKIYVEGGGDTKALQTKCRQGFSELIQKSGVAKKMPKIIACGSRKHAYDDFCTALRAGEDCYLLVDSESTISAQDDISVEMNRLGEPWNHLRNRVGDQWQRPDAANNDRCHLMVECMENWLIADLPYLEAYFGHGFKRNKIPPVINPEKIRKADIYDKVCEATASSKKGRYSKGEHSFAILKDIDPQKLISKCPWAKRFFDQLERVCN
jgi:hypothetical protein